MLFYMNGHEIWQARNKWFVERHGYYDYNAKVYKEIVNRHYSDVNRDSTKAFATETHKKVLRDA